MGFNGTEEMLWATGCRFRHLGVICKDITKCEGCGWNPEEEAKRKARIRKAAPGGANTEDGKGKVTTVSLSQEKGKSNDELS